MSSRLQLHHLMRSVYVFSPIVSPVLGWGFSWESFMSYVHTHYFCIITTVYFHSVLVNLFHLPVVLVLVLTYHFTNLGSKWSLAISNKHSQSALKGKSCHQLDWLYIFPLFHWLTNILAVEPFLFPLGSFRDVHFVRQIQAELLCLKHV